MRLGLQHGKQLRSGVLRGSGQHGLRSKGGRESLKHGKQLHACILWRRSTSRGRQRGRRHRRERHRCNRRRRCRCQRRR